MRIKKLLVSASFLLLINGLMAQKSFGHLVLGLQSGFDVAQFTPGEKAKALPALTLEGSLGPVSVGVGIGRSQYPKYYYYSFTGDTVHRPGDNGATVTKHLANYHSFKPAYWIVPAYINIRVHKCDCVYLHAGMYFEKVDLGRPDIIEFYNAEFDQLYSGAVDLQRGQLVKPRIKSFEFGVGFNVYKRDFFRLIARPTYVLTENPEVYSNSDVREYLPTLRFTFGAQIALWRERTAD